MTEESNNHSKEEHISNEANAEEVKTEKNHETNHSEHNHEHRENNKYVEHSHSEERKKGSDDEYTLDFGAITSKMKNLFSSTKSKKDHHIESEEKHHKDNTEISLDIKSIGSYCKKNAKWLIPLACILIAMFASVYLRTMPQRMPIANEWAESTVFNHYRNNIEQQINQQYPNLPQQNRDSLIEKEWEKFRTQNKDQINNDLNNLASQYKEKFKDNENNLYLLGIDPYHFYRQASNVIEFGHAGTEIKDGNLHDTYMNAPTGAGTSNNFHATFSAYWHKFLSLFSNIHLMSSFFYVGVLFSALSVIPAFFIGKRITGNNVGGFFTSFLMATSAFFVSRTTGESSDTDVYVIFFPLVATWLWLEAFDAKTKKQSYIYTILAGFFTGMFAYAWVGWWYIFGILCATLVIDSGVSVVSSYIKKNKEIDIKKIKENATSLVVYIVSSGVFVTLFQSFRQFYRVFLEPLSFIKLKEVAVTRIWPTVGTTVAELNVPEFSAVIGQLGGKVLFTLSLIGVVIALFSTKAKGKKNTKVVIMLAIWFAASLYGTTKGVRFILQATPVFSLALGAFLGIVYGYSSKWVSKELKFPKKTAQVIIFILLAVILIKPAQAGYEAAYRSVPSINDAWYDTLSKIEADTPEDTIITSWWDFGHWFKAVADRRVTFDGASRAASSAHWVGKSLLTSNEKESAGILRMLNCGNNNGFEKLNEIIDDPIKTINLLNKIVILNNAQASARLSKEGLSSKQINLVLQFTHCTPPDAIFITSEDMVGKAGVWGHFGSWDFERASIYQKTRSTSMSKGIDIIMKDFGKTKEETTELFNQIQSTGSADSFIAPWPNYFGNGGCQEEGNLLTCSFRAGNSNGILEIDRTTMDATIRTGQGVLHPKSLVYQDGNKTKEISFNGDTVDFSIILLPSNQIVVASQEQANGVFTQLFFFNGVGSQCFEKFENKQSFNGQRIISWKVNWQCLE